MATKPPPQTINLSLPQPLYVPIGDGTGVSIGIQKLNFSINSAGTPSFKAVELGFKIDLGGDTANAQTTSDPPPIDPR
jgi:hypothetical protein